MYNLNQDLSQLTTVPKLQLDNMVKTSLDIICHNVQESLSAKETITTIDIGIGTLYIKVEGEEIKYKFIPSHRLENGIKYTVTTGESPLIDAVANVLKDRICNTYKDLF